VASAAFIVASSSSRPPASPPRALGLQITTTTSSVASAIQLPREAEVVQDAVLLLLLFFPLEKGLIQMGGSMGRTRRAGALLLTAASLLVLLGNSQLRFNNFPKCFFFSFRVFSRQFETFAAIGSFFIQCIWRIKKLFLPLKTLGICFCKKFFFIIEYIIVLE
jgi:hypothetical protein